MQQIISGRPPKKNTEDTNVNVVNAGDIGGGVQYTEGDTDASITGNAMMMEVGGNTLQPIQGTVAGGILVNLGSNNDITGTVTANAGTNLNTSALALESGGNLATLAGVDFATSAKQDTIIGHIDGIEALLTTIDTDTSNLDVALSTRASAANQVHKFASGISGATKVNASLQGQTADATLYTVVETLFQGIVTLTVRNTSTTTNGLIHVRDGNGGTILFSVSKPQNIIGQIAPVTTQSFGTDAFPIEAGTALYLDVVSGSPVVDIHAVGIDT